MMIVNLTDSQWNTVYTALLKESLRTSLTEDEHTAIMDALTAVRHADWRREECHDH
jgi:hypothetical protein